MAQSLEELGLELGYNTAESDLLQDFYVPCLKVATSYDRAVGYFRSSIYSMVGVAISDFVLRGGKMRIACSPGLTSEDIEAISSFTRDQDVVVSDAMTREIEQVLAHPENLPVVELLSTLIHVGALELKIAYRPGASGIFHEKLGLFTSSVDSLSFSGSANETYAAWDPMVNHEGFETFGSWDSSDARRVDRHAVYFENLWTDNINGLAVRPLPEVPAALLEKHANDDGVGIALERARSHLKRVGRCVTHERKTLQEHQLSVVEAWSENKSGIIDHVTGAGKTISALEILRRWLTPDRRACAIVIVPGRLLSRQWVSEINAELADLNPSMLLVGGTMSNPQWRNRLAMFTSPSPAGPRIVVATLGSAAKPDFISRVQAGEHLLLIADEVHAVGSPVARSVTRIDAGGRLGLSATPERFHDGEGTECIFDYFGDILPPKFGIPEAMKAGRLVPYDYHVRTVLLDEDEAAEYRSMTEKISQLQARIDATDDTSLNGRLDFLRIQRARIIKKARNKVPRACDVLQEAYRSGQKWLVYCEDTEQLDQMKERLLSAAINVMEYHTQMPGDPSSTLTVFQRYGGVLVSIRCLDQGVDIPSIDHAMILASSTNPRQFIQRRGRVLRTAPYKYSANIFDLLVCKDSEGSELVLNRDLERARIFASTARNIACQYKLDELSAALEDAGVEFEDESEGESVDG